SGALQKLRKHFAAGGQHIASGCVHATPIASLVSQGVTVAGHSMFPTAGALQPAYQRNSPPDPSLSSPHDKHPSARSVPMINVVRIPFIAKDIPYENLRVSKSAMSIFELVAHGA